MTRIDYKTRIKESEEYLQERLSKLSSKKLYSRCEVLLWLKSGRVKSMRQAIILKGMNKSQGSAWWKQYEEEGIEGFLQLCIVLKKVDRLNRRPNISLQSQRSS